MFCMFFLRTLSSTTDAQAQAFFKDSKLQAFDVRCLDAMPQGYCMLAVCIFQTFWLTSSIFIHTYSYRKASRSYLEKHVSERAQSGSCFSSKSA